MNKTEPWGDQKWSLIGAVLCFSTAIIMSYLKLCTDATTIGILIGGGVGAVGSISGLSQPKGHPAAQTTTTIGTNPTKIETTTEQK